MASDVEAGVGMTRAAAVCSGVGVDLRVGWRIFRFLFPLSGFSVP